MKISLVVAEGAKAKRIAIQLPTTIGRSDRAKLKLRSSEVSRTHCEIYDSKGKVIANDLGSSNGTLVNGVRIKTPTELVNGDTLKVGPVTFRVLLGGPEKQSEPQVRDSRSSEPTIPAKPVAVVCSDTKGEAAAENADTDENLDVSIPQVAEAIASDDPKVPQDVLPDVTAKAENSAEKEAPTFLQDTDLLDDDPLEPEPSADPILFDVVPAQEATAPESVSSTPRTDVASPPTPVVASEEKDDFVLPSVVTYEETDEGSFIDIQEVGDFLKAIESERPKKVDFVIDDLPVKREGTVDSQDSALNDFFKRFE